MNPPVHTVADPACELHQDWPTKPDWTARCVACRPPFTLPDDEVADLRECPQAKFHGNPFRYCPCGWMEDSTTAEVSWDENSKRAVWDALTQAAEEIRQYATAVDGAAGVVRILRRRLVGRERP